MSEANKPLYGVPSNGTPIESQNEVTTPRIVGTDEGKGSHAHMAEVGPDREACSGK